MSCQGLHPSVQHGSHSMCTNKIHTFLEVEAIVSLTYKGPAKSTPVYDKGRASLTRNEGSGGACDGQYDFA